MAIILKENGVCEHFKENHDVLTYQQINEVVTYAFTLVKVPNSHNVLIVDQNAKIKNKSINVTASKLAQTEILGNTILCVLSEIPFNNEKRTRYYGLRIGDIVSCESRTLKQFTGEVKVVGYGFSDNNRVIVEQNGRQFDCVAEWLDIVKKVEDIVEEPVPNCCDRDEANARKVYYNKYVKNSYKEVVKRNRFFS